MMINDNELQSRKLQSRVEIRTKNASRGVGPYSQAIIAHGFVFLSGQMGIDPKTEKLVSGGVAAEAAQALRNVSMILNAAKSDWAEVVKCTIYLADITAFEIMNVIYSSVLQPPLPARAAVAVVALPMGAAIQIDVTALVHGNRSTWRVVCHRGYEELDK